MIAEHKRRSPSAGLIRGDLTLEQVVRAYERGGAALCPCSPRRRGSADRSETWWRPGSHRLPILRKDFIVDPYQVHEALAAGADAVLLIVAALEDDELAMLLGLAETLQLDALVEVHDAAELERAAATGAGLIGINNRDLTTLEVDVRTSFELRGRVPAGVVTVAESGLRTRAQLDELEASGLDAVLVGEALMRSADVELACAALTGAATGVRENAPRI